jgi:LPXTG-motif cell wall-anchored protein
MQHQTIAPIRRARVIIASITALVLALAAAPLSATAAASIEIDFTSSGYTVGALKPAGQNGWWQAKVADFSLVDNSTFPASGLPSDGRSLQFSNSTIPSGGAHLVSPTVDAAGEPTTAATSNTFEVEFTVASATGALQDGLGVDVALDGASRYGGVVNLRHTADGLEIGSYWVPADATAVDNASWRSAVFTTVDATVPHTVRLVAVFLADRPDSLQVFVDDVLVSAGSGATTWEYYSTLAGSGGDRSVDSLSFKSTASAPSSDGIGYTAGIAPLASAAGKGFLFTGISYGASTSAPPVPTTPPTVPPTADSTPDAALTLTDSTVDSAVAFSATGFLAYENVFAAVYPSASFGGWFQANAAGEVSGSVTLPSGYTPGTQTLQLTGDTTARTAAANFTQNVPTLPTEPPVIPPTADATPDGTISLDDDTVAGGALTFEASGFSGFESVYAAIYPGGSFGGWFQPTGSGVVSGSVTLPADLVPGSHTLQLTGVTSGWIAATDFTKTPPPLPTEPPVLPTAPDPTPDAEAELGDDTPTGTTVTFTAAGFDPFENAFVTIFSTPQFGGWFQADASGVVSGTVTLPAGLAAGTHTLQVTGETSGWTAVVEFSLAAAAPGVPTPTQLPLTGTDSLSVLMLAGGLLGLGLAIVLVPAVRRRKSR